MHRPIAEYRRERWVVWVRYRYRTGRKYLRLGSDDILRERGRGEYRLHDRAGSVEPGDLAVQKRCAFVDRSRRYYPTIACGERRIVVFSLLCTSASIESTTSSPFFGGSTILSWLITPSASVSTMRLPFTPPKVSLSANSTPDTPAYSSRHHTPFASAFG